MHHFQTILLRKVTEELEDILRACKFVQGNPRCGASGLVWTGTVGAGTEVSG